MALVQTLIQTPDDHRELRLLFDPMSLACIPRINQIGLVSEKSVLETV